MNILLKDGCLYSQGKNGFLREIAKPLPPDQLYKLSLGAAEALKKAIDDELLNEFRKKFESFYNGQ